MNGTRRNAKNNWVGYIALGGLLVWAVILGSHAQAWYGLAGIGLIVAVIGGITWGVGILLRHSRAANVDS